MTEITGTPQDPDISRNLPGLPEPEFDDQFGAEPVNLQDEVSRMMRADGMTTGMHGTDPAFETNFQEANTVVDNLIDGPNPCVIVDSQNNLLASGKNQA